MKLYLHFVDIPSRLSPKFKKQVQAYVTQDLFSFNLNVESDVKHHKPKPFNLDLCSIIEIVN